MAVILNRRNWFKFCTLISSEDEYFIASSSFFDHLDFSWREFACEFIQLLGNWLRATCKEVPALLLETISCLRELHEVCDHVGKDIETLLGTVNFDNLNEYLTDNDYFCLGISYTCKCLKKNCLNHPKKIHRLQKNLLKIKKKFLRNKKKFLELDEKYSMFNKGKFLLSFSTLIWNYYK